MVKGVTTATSNAGRVKVGDYGSQITIQLDNVEKDALQAVEWVRAYPVNSPVKNSYIDIPDHTVAEGILFITLPEIPRGTYNLEIKDEDGRIYPAEGTLRLEMLPSTTEAKEVYYVTYRELILEDVTPIVTGYLSSNPDSFKGDKGDKGDKGEKGEQGEQGIQGVKGDKGDTGLTGEQGEQGIQGIKGDTGGKGDKGEKGDKGDTTAAPPKVFTRAEYDALPTKSADTLYIVKEVE